ncbi:glycosyltransferase family 4 protein [Actinokineospora globicatena]|uniref:glycosyltransferase family 4 protein n=1 Tax=Actinokineospora globicatena TaxID=103729 RepID=UPI0020A39AE7|nr:glycosyltransferase family 4 protein [Actinokineospora globicatena]MCP2302521.1 phosphatidylinositol alpha-1,6-mannosyltransferase [Actinokineospora globicatena]GLW75792.1 GDP-mannose-dependent alpha-(1-6)-phosphatidylinositol monomannoside mannosyltransferase [Actinokineospora globicatena]GLW82632.1 GDP-mannose-dependent alpha-(1-6)-phosphatidylinositol monomannoside mannosyltransferase [Actinokineospora globicatena]
MRKTLLVTNDFPPRPGGIQTYLHSFAKWLPDLVVYAPAWEGAEAFDAAQPFTVVRHPGKLMVPTPAVARRAREILRAEGCDSAWFGAAAPLALLAPVLRKAGARRVVASTHGHEVGWSMLPGARQSLRRIGSTTDVVTYVSGYTRSRFAAAFGPSAALELLPSGVDTELYRPDAGARASIRARHGLGDRPVVVCVSRLMPRKGQDVLIRALPEIRSRVPGAALLLVGGGPYRSRLESIAAQAGVTEHVVFTGAVPWEELPAHYAAGDVFAMPCRTHGKGLDVEALGIVFLEAAATGLPVIVGDSGGAPETVRDGVSGHVVNGRAVADIASRIADLLADPALASEMGAAGRRWMQKDWTWSTRAARLRHLLDGETVYRFSAN